MATFNGFNAGDKLLNYLDKLNSFFSIGKTLIVAELDLTNKCNNRCPQCVGKNQQKEELTWAEIQSIAAGMKALDAQGVILSGGGEPLLHKNFIDTLKLFHSLGIQIGLNSNGLALTKTLTDAISEYCAYFRISLDAGDADLYRQTHGMERKSFDTVVNHIRLMAETKKMKNSSLSFGTGFLTGQYTIQQMEPFVKLSKECGADYAQFRPFQGDWTPIDHTYWRLKEQYEDERFKVLASMQKYNQFIQGGERRYDRCRGMFFSTVITANARVYACLHHRQDEQYLIGDMRKGDTLEQIWNSYRKWKVYEDIDVSKCPSFCRNDTINQTLADLSKSTNHKEFL